MRTGSYGIAPDHLMLGLLRHRENSATDALRGLGIDVEEMKQFIDTHIFTNEHIPYSEIDNITFSRGVQNVLSFTILEATKLRNRQAGVEHLLLALCRAGDSYGVTYLRDLGVDYGMIYRYMEKNSMLERGPEETQQEEEAPQIRTIVFVNILDTRFLNNRFHNNHCLSVVLEFLICCWEQNILSFRKC